MPGRQRIDTIDYLIFANHRHGPKNLFHDDFAARFSIGIAHKSPVRVKNEGNFNEIALHSNDGPNGAATDEQDFAK